MRPIFSRISCSFKCIGESTSPPAHRIYSSSLTPLYWQLLNLNPMIRVVQLALLEVLVYSWVYQKVQSSPGSICMVL